MTATPRLLAALLLCALCLARPAAAQYAGSFRIGGDVQTPQLFDLKKLEALPSTKLDVYFNTGSGPVEAAFTGVLLWDLLNAAGVITDPNIKNDILRKVIVASGSDGYEVAFTAGELDPEFGGHQVIVAYLQDGVPLDSSSGFARLVAPNDKAGGRAVFNLTRLRVVTTH